MKNRWFHGAFLIEGVGLQEPDGTPVSNARLDVVARQIEELLRGRFDQEVITVRAIGAREEPTHER